MDTVYTIASAVGNASVRATGHVASSLAGVVANAPVVSSMPKRIFSSRLTDGECTQLEFIRAQYDAHIVTTDSYAATLVDGPIEFQLENRSPKLQVSSTAFDVLLCVNTLHSRIESKTSQLLPITESMVRCVCHYQTERMRRSSLTSTVYKDDPRMLLLEEWKRWVMHTLLTLPLGSKQTLAMLQGRQRYLESLMNAQYFPPSQYAATDSHARTMLAVFVELRQLVVSATQVVKRELASTTARERMEHLDTACSNLLQLLVRYLFSVVRESRHSSVLDASVVGIRHPHDPDLFRSVCHSGSGLMLHELMCSRYFMELFPDDEKQHALVAYRESSVPKLESKHDSDTLSAITHVSPIKAGTRAAASVASAAAPPPSAAPTSKMDASTSPTSDVISTQSGHRRFEKATPSAARSAGIGQRLYSHVVAAASKISSLSTPYHTDTINTTQTGSSPPPPPPSSSSSSAAAAAAAATKATTDDLDSWDLVDESDSCLPQQMIRQSEAAAVQWPIAAPLYIPEHPMFDEHARTLYARASNTSFAHDPYDPAFAAAPRHHSKQAHGNSSLANAALDDKIHSLMQSESSGIVPELRQQRPFIDAFVSLHALTHALAGLNLTYREARRVAGLGGDILVMQFAKQLLSMVSSTHDLITLIEEHIDTINTFVDDHFRVSVQRIAADGLSEWQQNYNALLQLRWKLSEQIQYARSKADDLQAHANVRSIERRMHEAKQEISHFVNHASIFCSEIAVLSPHFASESASNVIEQNDQTQMQLLLQQPLLSSKDQQDL
jgi:hypothetical protein